MCVLCIPFETFVIAESSNTQQQHVHSSTSFNNHQHNTSDDENGWIEVTNSRRNKDALNRLKSYTTTTDDDDDDDNLNGTCDDTDELWFD